MKRGREIVRTVAYVLGAALFLGALVIGISAHSSRGKILKKSVGDSVLKMARTQWDPLPADLRTELEAVLEKGLPEEAMVRKGPDDSTLEVEWKSGRYYLERRAAYYSVMEKMDSNGVIISKWTLIAAMSVTLLITALQFVVILGGKRGVMSGIRVLDRFDIVSLLVVFGGLTAAIAVCYLKGLVSPLPYDWMRRFVPTWENLIILAVAAAFVRVDFHLGELGRVEGFLWQADLAIAFSIFFSGAFVGFLGEGVVGGRWISAGGDLISNGFLHAYNVGVLTFHMFLGVWLGGMAIESCGHRDAGGGTVQST